jgi:hypothetical protein
MKRPAKVASAIFAPDVKKRRGIFFGLISGYGLRFRQKQSGIHSITMKKRIGE